MAQIRRALVTGASAGLGEEFARQLAGRGTDLVLVARREDALERVARPLRLAGRDVEVLTADLATAAGREAVVARLVDEDAPVDMLVNNAGFGDYGPVAEQDPAVLERMVEVNVVAVQQLAHAAARTMGPRGRGGIINLASTAAFQPDPHGAVYGATKTWVLSFSQALTEELRDTGVRVTAVCPGITATEFQQVAEIGIPIPDAAVMAAEQVVRIALDGFTRGRAVVVTGATNVVTAHLSALLPDAVTRRVSGLLHDRFTA